MAVTEVFGRRPAPRVEFYRISIVAPRTALVDRSVANDLRERLLEGREDRPESVLVLDLQNLRTITSSAADALIVRWLLFARQKRPFVLAIATPVDAVAHDIDIALRLAHETGYRIRRASKPDSEEPEVLGDRPEHHEELLQYLQAHPYSTANDVATAMDLGQTAALNRLAGASRRGLICRLARPGKQPDLFALPFSRMPRI